MKKTLSIMLMIVTAAWFAGTLFAQTLNLDYSTYLGGGDLDRGFGIALDSLNRAYVTGETKSSNFPVKGAYQTSNPAPGSEDVFINQLSSSGSSLIYSTYLGGDGVESGYGIALDSLKRAYVIGKTTSTNFPTKSAYQASKSDNYDVFISALASSGSSLIYSTYLGGTGSDVGEDISLDSLCRAYVAGYTNSSNFPVKSAYQISNASPGAWDAFISQLSSSGSSLVYSTYLGGASYEYGYGIALDSLNRAYVTGETWSPDFPTKNAFQTSLQYKDAFVTQLSSSGSSLVYSTYLGGSLEDRGRDISVDSLKRAYMTGETSSDNFPTKSAYQSSCAGYFDAFVSQLSSSGTSLVYSTYLGGGDTDWGYNICLDSLNGAYVTGGAWSTDFPVIHAYQASNPGVCDVFVSRLSSSGSSLVYSTYLGGGLGYGIALDSLQRAYVTGSTSSPIFPTRNAYQASFGGGDYDAFVSKLVFGSRRSWIYDYNGDGTSDVAIFRGSSGMWSVRNLTRLYYGLSTDDLVPGDYNGDGTTDVAIFRESSGMWSVRNLSRFYLGGANDQPVPGDYSGDSTAEAGIFRPSSGLWSIRNLTRIYLGSAADTVIPGYYDSDSKKDIAIFRGTTGMWSVRNLTRFYFGAEPDDLVPGDYNGAGKWEAGIFRPSSSMWSIRNLTRFYLGSADDRALPADYDGNGVDDAGIFRDSTGMWSVRNLTRVYFGGTGDIPVTR